MAPASKDLLLTADQAVQSPEGKAASRAPEFGAVPRSQPVCMEIPVTVEGSRGTDQDSSVTVYRNPFFEKTETVILFARGAVVRMSAAVAPGQFLELTNLQSKKEVRCRVVNTRAGYASAPGYVEVEFAEPSPGFWGLSFPEDVMQKAVSTQSKTAPQKTEIQAKVAQVATVEKPAVVEKQEKLPEPEKIEKLQRLEKLEKLENIQKTDKPAPPVAAKPPALPKPSAPATSAAPAPPRPAAAVPSSPPVNRPVQTKILAAQALHTLMSSPAAGAEKSKEPSHVAAFTPKFTAPPAPPRTAEKPAAAPEKLETSAPASRRPENSVLLPATFVVPELERLQSATPVDLDAPAKTISPSKLVPLAEDPQPVILGESESSFRLSAGGFGMHADAAGSAAPSSFPLKWTLIAAGAALALVIVGGIMFVRRSSTPDVIAVNAPPSPTVAALQVTPREAAPGQITIEPAADQPPQKPQSQIKQPALKPAASPPAPVATQAAAPKPQQPAPPPAQKDSRRTAVPSFTLGAPATAMRHAASQAAGPAPGVSDPSESSGAQNALGGLLGTSNSQSPAPPPPVPTGGAVEPPKLISSVPPVYPVLAKQNHTSGDVVVDAEIEANGAVGPMRVISGPVLLHQAAMDSVRRWKYAPGKLNGQAVSSHVQVRVQFRLN